MPTIAPLCPAPTGEWLPRVIGAIGGADFPGVLFQTLNGSFGVDHIVVATFRRRGRAAITTTAGRIPAAIASRQARDYAENDWCRRDPNLPLVLSTGPEARAVSDQLAPGRYTWAYRRRFFDDPHIVDKVAFSARVEDDCWLYANFHRLADSGPFAEAVRADLLRHGPLLVAALARHRYLVEHAGELDATGPAFRGLSPREREVCAAILSGMTLLGTALSLGVSINTVRTLRRRAYARMGISSQRQLVRLALRRD